jgi:polar amino acid transport system substrate-binding protein
MKKRHLFTMAVAVSSLIVSTVVSVPSANAAEGTLKDILSRGKLIVGTGSGNPPFHFLDTSGKLVGMDIDIAKAIAKGLFNDETKVEFVQQASDSRIPNIVSGKVDITCQFMTVTATRAQQVAFTDPYYREGVGLLLKKGGKYKNYAALLKAGSAARISILQNVTADAYVKAALPKAKVLQYAETALIYTAVDAGRADAAAADQSAIAWLVANNPTKYVDSGYGWLPQTYSCALKQGDQVWLNFVNQVLNEAMSGVDFDAYAASFKKWFGVTLPPPKIGFPR